MVGDSHLGNGVGGVQSPAASGEVDGGRVNIIGVAGPGNGGKVIIESNVGSEVINGVIRIALGYAGPTVYIFDVNVNLRFLSQVPRGLLFALYRSLSHKIFSVDSREGTLVSQ
eukprot:1185273-Heterocapsa_arctica.AAC.1